MSAMKQGIRNFSVFCNHVTIVPAIRAILDSPDMRLDGFIGPGHVSTVIGCRPYEWIAKAEGKPRTILFNLCGHGHFDMQSYIAYQAGQLQNYDYPAEEIAMALAGLPTFA